MWKKTILALTKIFFNKKFGDLGIQGHGKGHKVKQLKKKIFFVFGDRFGILGEFPLRLWFCDPHGTCRF